MEKTLPIRFIAIFCTNFFKRCGLLAGFMLLLGSASLFAGPVIKNNVSVAYALDKLGLTGSTQPAGAYSMRLLSSNYTGPLARILTSGSFYDVYPDATTGKAFSLTSPVSAAYTSDGASSTGATATTLATVVGSNSATVAIWFDQSLNTRNAVQSNSSLQPQIVNAGTVVSSNGKPAIKFTGAQYLIVTTTAFNADLSGSVVYTATSANTSGGGNNTWYNMNGILGSEQGGNIADFAYGVYNGKFTAGYGLNDNSLGSTNTVTDNVIRISSWTRSNATGSISLFNNNSANGSVVLSAGNRSSVPSVAIGAATTVGQTYFNGTISEIALFPLVYNSAERLAIESSQSSYYGVFFGQPQISVNGSLAALSTTQGTASASRSFYVSGSDLNAGILVTPPAGFEVSADNISFSSTVTVGTGGTVASTIIYIRLSASASYGSYSGNITLSSTDATSVTIPTAASTVSPVATGLPTLSYGAAQNFAINKAITPVSPAVAGVAAFGYGNAVNFGSALIQIGSIKEDKQGNIYMLDLGTYKIYKYASGSNTGVEIATDGAYPSAMAIDDAGNLYLADAGYGFIKKIDAGTGAISTIANGVSYVYNMVIAKDGTLYMADGGFNAIKKLLPGSNTAVEIGVAFDNATDVAVDVDGNLYVADQANMAVKKVWLSTDSHVETVYSGTQVISLTIDKANNVIAGDVQYSRLIIIPADGSGAQTIASGSSYQYPGGLWMDDKGAIYVANYTANAMMVTPTGGYFIDSNLPAGLSFNQNTGVISGTPTKVSPATPYHVTAYNSAGGTTSSITIGVIADKDLSNLLTDVGTLTPVFNADSTTYKLTVTNGVTSANITATLNTLSNGLTVNGVAATSDMPASVGLNAGDNIIAVVITSPIDSTTKTYSVNIHRISNDYKLASLTSSAGNLNPGFDRDISSYQVTVPYTTSSATITPTLSNVYGSVKVDNVLVVSSSASQSLPLVAGDNIYEVRSTAEDGTSATIYTVNIHRTEPVLYISTLAPSVGMLSPVFNGSTTNYSLSVPEGTPSISLTPSLADEGAAVTINGAPATSGVASAPISLNDGYNTISLVFTAADSTTTQTYTIVVNRLVPVPTAGSNASYVFAAGAAIEPTSPGFNGVGAPAYNPMPAVIATTNTPTGIALTKTDTLYIASIGLGGIYKVPATGGSLDLVLAGQNTPLGVAADADGNVYVADLGNTVIKKIAAGTGTVSNVGSALSFPTGVTIDKAGNVYIGETANSRIKKIAANNGAITVMATGIDSPYGLAVDAAGNVYVASPVVGSIIKVTADGTKTNFITGLVGPTDVKIDAAGNFFVVNAGANTIVKYDSDGANPVVISSRYEGLFALAIAPNGNVYNTDNGTQKINSVAPAGGYFISDVLPAGLVFNSATGVISGTPTVVSAAKDYTIYGYNTAGFATQTVNLQVGPALPFLASLTTPAALTPAFDSTIVSYTATVPYSMPTYTVTPVSNTPGSSITVDGSAVTSGSASPAVTLSVGPNIIPVIVTAGDGITSKQYTLNITRATPSADATLASMGLNNATLSPIFSSAATEYTATVTAATSTTKVTVGATVAGSAVTVNGETVQSGQASSNIPLVYGPNTININVTAEDGTLKEYVLTVTRSMPNAALSGIALSSSVISPVFNAATLRYTAKVSYSVETLSLIPITDDATSTIKVNGVAVASGASTGPIALALGTGNIINVEVTATNGTVKTYKVTVTRNPPSWVAGLSMKLSPFAQLTQVPADGADVNFTASVANAVEFVTLTPTPTQPFASITVNGVAVAGGTASGQLPLNVGANIIDVKSTAENGYTRRSYRITITRAGGSHDAGLSLALSPYAVLKQVAADGADVNFTASVASAIASVTLTATPSQANATITINGVSVAAGAPSAALPLNIGKNVIDVVGTAQNGYTKRKYRVTITRAGGSSDAGLSLALSPYAKLTQVTANGADVNFTASVTSAVASVALTATPHEANATITVNGVAVASGVPSQDIALKDGVNIIDVICTAQNGYTKRSYRIALFKQSEFARMASTKDGTKVLFANKANSFAPADNDGVVVRQGVSPNGDGSNDFMVIEGITAYSGNKVSIMDANGSLVYDTKNYGDNGNMFDGHSKNGAKLKPGTYFYALEYTVNSQSKRKTGFIVLKY